MRQAPRANRHLPDKTIVITTNPRTWGVVIVGRVFKNYGTLSPFTPRLARE